MDKDQFVLPYDVSYLKITIEPELRLTIRAFYVSFSHILSLEHPKNMDQFVLP